MATVARDLLVYLAFSVLPAAGFYLSGYPDAPFYISLLVLSLVVLVAFQVWQKESGLIVAYDSNLDFWGLMLIALGVMGSLAVASYLVSNYVTASVGTVVSSIYVPVTKLGLTVGQLQLPGFYSDVLFTLTLVAPAEECAKLVTSVGLYSWLGGVFGRGGQAEAKVISAVTPIVVWALLHTYRNPMYQGQYMLVMVLTAFLAGLIIFAVMQRTKSLLAAILCHAIYNIIILYLTYNPV